MIAGECENSSYYHVEPSYGYCEVIDDNGIPSKKGQIVATGFLNYAMPLIRYKTGDVGSLDDCDCACNRHYQIIKKIEGRWHQDGLINSDNAFVSLTALNIHSEQFNKVK